MIWSGSGNICQVRVPAVRAGSVAELTTAHSGVSKLLPTQLLSRTQKRKSRHESVLRGNYASCKAQQSTPRHDGVRHPRVPTPADRQNGCSSRSAYGSNTGFQVHRTPVTRAYQTAYSRVYSVYQQLTRGPTKRPTNGHQRALQDLAAWQLGQ